MNTAGSAEMSPTTLAQMAGILSHDPKFERFLHEAFGFEGQAENFIRGHCDIASRKALDLDPIARRKFLELRNLFDAWRGVIAAPR